MFCKVRKNKTQWVYSHHLSSLHCSKSVRNWMFKKFLKNVTWLFSAFSLWYLSIFFGLFCVSAAAILLKPETENHQLALQHVIDDTLELCGLPKLLQMEARRKFFNPFIESHNSKDFWLIKLQYRRSIINFQH